MDFELHDQLLLERRVSLINRRLAVVEVALRRVPEAVAETLCALALLEAEEAVARRHTLAVVVGQAAMER